MALVVNERFLHVDGTSAAGVCRDVLNRADAVGGVLLVGAALDKNSASFRRRLG